MWAFYRKFFVWEQRKLGDIVTFYRGLTYSPKNVHKTGTLVLRSSNVKNNVIINADNVYVDPKIVNSSNVKKDDLIVVVRNGSKSLLGKHAEVIRNMPNTVIGAFMTGIKTKHSNFVNALLSTELFKSEMHKNMGSTINQITGHIFSNMTFNFPKNKEQNKTGNLFKIINKILFLQERKYEELKLLKKALMQNMFANKTAYPKLRFNGFNSKWKSYKLKEIGKIVTGNTPPTKDLNNYSDHGMLWVTPTDITGPIIRNTVKRLSPIGITKARTAKEGSILVTCIASIGKNALTETRCGFNQQINAVIPNQYNDSYFLLIQSKFWSKKAKQIAAKGTIKIVNKKDFSNLSFLYPKLKEQKNMSSFFKLLDMVTTFQMKNLIELKKIKHFLLQNMFI